MSGATAWIEALALGVIQGLTEFLPVSSSGHLKVAQSAIAWLTGVPESGAENLLYTVLVHLGTLAAIVLHYRAQAATGLRGLLGSGAVEPGYRRADLARTAALVVVATLPAIPVGLFLKKQLEAAFASLSVAGVGFLVTATILLLTTRMPGGRKDAARTRWLDAFLIGTAQAFATLPGVSRSGMTIAAALALGLSRGWAVGFSLLMAVPAILGGAVLELKDYRPGTIDPSEAWPMLAAAVAAGVVGYGAIVWLVRVVRAGRLWYFSVYLIVLGVAVLAVASQTGGRPDGPSPDALDRPARLGDPRPGDVGPAGGAFGALDRADAAGAGAGRP